MNFKNLLDLTRNNVRSYCLPMALVAIAFTGCATPATKEAMTASTITVTKKHSQTVSVTVSGGKETNSAGKSQISDLAFRQAIIDSINQSQVFSKAMETGGQYSLTAVITSMDQPSFGLNFTVKMEAAWTLKKADTGATVWQEVVKSEHTATTSDAFAGVARLRMANEGAAKNNIANALAKISTLKL